MYANEVVERLSIIMLCELFGLISAVCAMIVYGLLSVLKLLIMIRKKINKSRIIKKIKNNVVYILDDIYIYIYIYIF